MAQRKVVLLCVKYKPSGLGNIPLMYAIKQSNSKADVQSIKHSTIHETKLLKCKARTFITNVAAF